MLDFKITNSGDLAFSDEIVSEKITLKFEIAEYPSFLLTFNTPYKTKNEKREGVTVFFDTNKTPDLNNKFSAIKDYDEIAQAIRIRIRTEFEELERRSSVGSTLLLWKHTIINDNMINNIKVIIQDILDDIVEDAKYSVEVLREEGTGNFYCQNVTVYIYHEDELIYQFYW